MSSLPTSDGAYHCSPLKMCVAYVLSFHIRHSRLDGFIFWCVTYICEYHKFMDFIHMFVQIVPSHSCMSLIEDVYRLGQCLLASQKQWPERYEWVERISSYIMLTCNSDINVKLKRNFWFERTHFPLISNNNSMGHDASVPEIMNESKILPEFHKTQIKFLSFEFNQWIYLCVKFRCKLLI